MIGHQTIRVAGIPHHQDAHVLGGVTGQGLALADKNFAVDAQQVLALHSLLARKRADEQRPVAILESLGGIICHDDVLEGREAAIVELHRHALQGRHGRSDFQQLQDDLAARSKNFSGHQPAQHGISHLARRPRHRYTNHVGHGNAPQLSLDQKPLGIYAINY